MLKLAGGDATKQFLMLHERSVLSTHGHLKIGTIDDSKAAAIVAGEDDKASAPDWMFGTWKPPLGTEKV